MIDLVHVLEKVDDHNNVSIFENDGSGQEEKRNSTESQREKDMFTLTAP